MTTSSILECLLINWPFDTSLPRWLALLEALPKLKYVQIWDRHESCLLDDSEYRQFFHVNSSLRLVMHEGTKKSDQHRTFGVKYVRDVGTNMIRKTEKHFDSTVAEGIPDYHYDETAFNKRYKVCENFLSFYSF